MVSTFEFDIVLAVAGVFGFEFESHKFTPYVGRCAPPVSLWRIVTERVQWCTFRIIK